MKIGRKKSEKIGIVFQPTDLLKKANNKRCVIVRCSLRHLATRSTIFPSVKFLGYSSFFVQITLFPSVRSSILHTPIPSLIC